MGTRPNRGLPRYMYRLASMNVAGYCSARSGATGGCVFHELRLPVRLAGCMSRPARGTATTRTRAAIPSMPNEDRRAPAASRHALAGVTGPSGSSSLDTGPRLKFLFVKHALRATSAGHDVRLLHDAGSQ